MDYSLNVVFERFYELVFVVLIDLTFLCIRTKTCKTVFSGIYNKNWSSISVIMVSCLKEVYCILDTFHSKHVSNVD